MCTVLWHAYVGDLIAAPDGPPQDVQLEALSSQSIRVTWRVSSSKQNVLMFPWSEYVAVAR